jgi:hypothetical protein
VRFEPRRAFIFLVIAGIAGGFLFLPAMSLIGSLLLPSDPPPASAHVPKLMGDALWAKTLGGRSNELQPLNPFTLGRMLSCHVLAERYEPEQRDAQHDECFKLIPAVQGVAYLSTIHMRAQGVWQDPRVPFVQIAEMTKLTSTWTRAELIDALAERGEFILGVQGVYQASQAFFNKPAAELSLPQTALVAGLLGQRRLDPWCAPEAAAAMRRRVLERMRDNGVIDDAAMQTANVAELGIGDPPASHKPCER